jgi:hypothetical protein
MKYVVALPNCGVGAMWVSARIAELEKTRFSGWLPSLLRRHMVVT